MTNVESQSEQIVQRALNIVQSIGDTAVVRLLGACAVRVHCPHHVWLLDTMKRSISDVDFVTYSKCLPELHEALSKMGYDRDMRLHTLFGHRRQAYYDNSGNRTDIFVDKLEMCHTIDFRGRLEVDSPTISLADVLLEKMQIAELTKKDMIDTIVLLSEHEIGDSDKESVNLSYVSKLLSADWGFYYTVTTNLERTKGWLDEVHEIGDEDRKLIASRIDQAIRRIAEEPKTTKWSLRAKVGTRKRWYNEVSDLTRGI